MPEKHNRRKRRSAPRLHHAGPDLAPSRARAEPDLLTDVRRMLSQSHPAELLHFASGLLAVADPRADDPFARVHGAPSKDVTVADLVGSFDVHVRETTALLTVLAQMIDDDLMARRIRRELARRDDRLPIAKAVGEWFGVGSNPGQRAPALLKAIDAPGRYFADVRLGTPRYLVADRRRGIAETRDRYRPPS